MGLEVRPILLDSANLGLIFDSPIDQMEGLCIRSKTHSGRVGSSKAMPMLPKVIAPGKPHWWVKQLITIDHLSGSVNFKPDAIM